MQLFIFSLLSFSQIPSSLIVVPIISALLVVVALIAGVFTYLSFRGYIRGREIADFDFISSPQEISEYRTFCQRLKDEILEAFPTTNIEDEAAYITSNRYMKECHTPTDYVTNVRQYDRLRSISSTN